MPSIVSARVFATKTREPLGILSSMRNPCRNRDDEIDVAGRFAEGCDLSLKLCILKKNCLSNQYNSAKMTGATKLCTYTLLLLNV